MKATLIKKKGDTGLMASNYGFLIVDSREQNPFWKGSECAKAPLIVGDYTTSKQLNRFHIDRKTGVDFYGTITSGFERFKKEIERAQTNNIKLEVFVECSYEDFIAKRFPHGNKLKYPSKGLARIVENLKSKFKLKITFCKSRIECKKYVLKALTS